MLHSAVSALITEIHIFNHWKDIMATLDRQRDFGTITGCDQGRLYEQDHAFFNADGSEWRGEATLSKASSRAPKAAPKADEPADDQLAEQLK